MRDERGIVLAQVLLLALLVCIMCAGIARLRLDPAAQVAGALGEVKSDLSGQAALNKLQDAWARSGSCASNGPSGVACSPGGHGPCDCRCSVSGVSVVSAPSGNSCALTVQP